MEPKCLHFFFPKILKFWIFLFYNYKNNIWDFYNFLSGQAPTMEPTYRPHEAIRVGPHRGFHSLKFFKWLSGSGFRTLKRGFETRRLA